MGLPEAEDKWGMGGADTWGTWGGAGVGKTQERLVRVVLFVGGVGDWIVRHVKLQELDCVVTAV